MEPSHSAGTVSGAECLALRGSGFSEFFSSYLNGHLVHWGQGIETMLDGFFR